LKQSWWKTPPVILTCSPVTWGRFHKHFTISLYRRRSQKRKKTLMTFFFKKRLFNNRDLAHIFIKNTNTHYWQSFFGLLGSERVKDAHKTLVKLIPRRRTSGTCRTADGSAPRSTSRRARCSTCPRWPPDKRSTSRRAAGNQL